MNRRLYAPVVIMIGLASAQIVGTAHVYLSNLELLQTTEAIMRSGYLPIPNHHVTMQLNRIATAMAGGIFFTLSIGTGLSLAMLIAIWLWDRVSRRNRMVTIPFFLLWAAGIWIINDNGWNPMATAYVVVVPAITGIAAIRLLPERTTLVSPISIVVWPITTALVLALLWGLVFDRHMFIHIRDHLLLSNRIGRAITEAYYRYTLYPAEAFKSLSQKQLRTCFLGEGLDPEKRHRMERSVRTRDYLPLPAGETVDLTIDVDGENENIYLSHQGRTVLTFTEKQWFANPSGALASYSRHQDKNQIFRRLTLGGLLIGFPLVLFTLVYSTVVSLPNLFLPEATSDIIAAILCLGIGVMLLVPVYKGHTNTFLPDTLPHALTAPSTGTRVAALRQAYDERQDIALAAKAHEIERSPFVAERYWLARSLAYARAPEARAMLGTLADDPVPLVVCQAMWAMGERKDRKMVPIIMQRIKSSPHWYIQMYGYRALRRLGWVQPRSRQLSY